MKMHAKDTGNQHSGRSSPQVLNSRVEGQSSPSSRTFLNLFFLPRPQVTLQGLLMVKRTVKLKEKRGEEKNR